MLSSAFLIVNILTAADAFHPPKVPANTVQMQIDGALDEPAWANAAAVSDFVVVLPDTLSKPSLPTTAKVFYTEDGIYVGIWSEQPYDQQIERLSPQDTWLEGDFVQVGVDPTGTGRYGYMFGIFLGGSVADGTMLPERRYNWNWDGPWRRATKRMPNGWSAEAFLPWTMFAMPRTEDKERQVGLYFSRWVAVLNERWAWPALPLTQPKFLSAFHPTVMEEVEPHSNIAGYPYIAPSYDLLGKKPQFRAGLDAFWNPTPQTRFSATVLPDFGQVDTDELVVNLTAFETFFPEKRPFFTEGQDIFQTGRVTMLHTRRIGAPPVAPAAPEGAQIEGLDKAAEILGAAKIVGQAGNVRYGLMGAGEADEEYALRNGDEVTPAELSGRRFGAGRILFEGEGKGYRAIGLMGTWVQTPQAAATVGAADGHFHTADGMWQTDGQGIFSYRADKGGYGGWVENTLTPSQGNVHTLALEHYGKDLQLNDFGFLRRNNLSRFEYKYLRTRAVGDLVKESITEVLTGHGWNSDQQYVDTLFQVSQGFSFRGNTTINAKLGYRLPYWDDRNSRGNGAFRVEDRLQARLEAWTDKSKLWILGAILEGRGEDLGGFSRLAKLSARVSPSQHFTLETNLTVEKLDKWLVWQQGRTFATYDGLQITPRIDVSALISPRQQFKLSAQWLGLRADPLQTLEIGDDGRLFEPVDSTPAAKLSRGTFALQVRYRYEFAPLSDLFLVYSRGGTSLLDTAYNVLARESFRTPNASLFMMKVRYRFDI